jgi:outer membrane lipoprotein-sorting protein
MKNRLIILTLLVLFTLFAGKYANAAEMTATEIVKKSDQLMRGKTTQGSASMEIVNPSWRRTISMDYWSSGSTKFFIHITAPVREKGTTFLKIDKNLYQYLPSAEMRIKISPSMMHQSWMGSDFTNDDLVKESSTVDDYTHKMIGQEDMAGFPAYKIQLDPKPNAPVVWGKLMVWYRKADLVPLREDFYDEKGNKIKTMNFSDIQNVGDRNYPMLLEMIPLNKQGHKTVYKVKKIKFNEQIPESVFSLKNLEKPR